MSGSADKTIKIWSVASRQTIKILNGHTKDVLGTAFSPDGKYIVSGSEDYSIKLWNVETGQEIRTFEGHKYYVKNVMFSPDGKTILSGSRDKTLKLWDVHTGKEIRTFSKESDWVRSVTFSPNGKYILSSSYKTIKLRDTKTGQEIRTFEGRTHNIACSAFSPDGSYIISGSRSILKLWHVGIGQELRTLNGHSYYVNSTAFSPDSKHFVSGSNKSIKLWNVASGTVVKTLKSRMEDVNSVKYSHNGKYIASGDDDNNIKLWNTETGKLIRTFGKHKKRVSNVAFSPDDKTIVSSDGYDKVIKLWNTNTGEETGTLEGHKKGVLCIAFSPDGKYIVSGSYDKTVKIWKTKTQEEIRVLTGHKSNVNSVNFSSDGKFILSASFDKTIKLWNAKNGEVIRTFEGHTNAVVNAEFSSTDKYIVSASGDGTIKIWKTKTGKLLLTLVALTGSDDFISYTPDGRFDGTEKGMELLHYVEGLDIIPLSSLFEKYYTPNLLARVMQGEEFKETEINIADIKLPPLVKITKPDNRSKHSSKTVSINVSATDQGGGIDEIRLYHNGKLADGTQRGLKPIERKNEKKTKNFIITLTNGENIIKATAFSNQRTESNPDEITVSYTGAKKTANLYMLVIGIDNYKNPKYKLNYALADASAFKKQIELGSKTIFGKTEAIYLSDTKASKQGIVTAFNSIKAKAQANDVFIFYYAGHGVMSEEQKSEFYIVPYEVTQLYGNNGLLRSNGVSAKELQAFSKDIKAQKQLFIFDACQSGGMVQHLAMRGAAEEKAIAQLARSTGTFWLAASNSEQFATEFSQLGHGLFTYTLLQALKGKADGSSKDKKITVKEISAYLNDMVPELSQKYKGSAQYPNSYGYGQDFPVVIVK